MRQDRRPALSDREKQLIELASQGFTDTAIGQQLGISEATVSTYWGRIRVKLGPFSRTELVALVLREESDRILEKLREENEALSRRLRLDTGDYNDGQNSNFYKDLLEVAADAMFLVNEQGVIENLNESAAELFGYAKDELLGGPISRLIPDRYRMVHDSHRNEYVEKPEKRRMGEHRSTVALRKDGKEFSIAATLSAIKVESGISVLCIVREIAFR